MPNEDEEWTLLDHFRSLFWPKYYCPCCGYELFALARSCRPVSGAAGCTRCGTTIIYGKDGKRARDFLDENGFKYGGGEDE